jgi:hypothetical protein
MVLSGFGLPVNVHRDVQAGCVRISRLIQDERLVFPERQSVIERLFIEAIRDKSARVLKLSSFFEQRETPYSLSGIEQIVWRSLADTTPHLALKASALTNLAHCLMDSGDYKPAAAALQEASRIQITRPELFGELGALARGLTLLNVGRMCGEVGQDETAVIALRDAIRFFKGYVKGGDRSALAATSTAYDYLARSLLQSGKKGALKLVVKATAIAKALKQLEPNLYEGEYIWRLITLGDIRVRMGNAPGALTAFEEAEVGARDLVKREPGQHEDMLAMIYMGKAYTVAAQKDYRRATELADEAVQFCNATYEMAGGNRFEGSSRCPR